jgi:hypothetical protein
MQTRTRADFDQRYQTHLKHLKLKGLQPKTIDAYARAIVSVRQTHLESSEPDKQTQRFSRSV